MSDSWARVLEEELQKVSAGSVSVIDIAKLSNDKQAFVFGDVLKTIYKLKLGKVNNVVSLSL